MDGVAEMRTFTIVGFLPEKSQHLDVADRSGLHQFPALITCESEPAFATGREGIHRVMELKDGFLWAGRWPVGGIAICARSWLPLCTD